MTPVWEIVSQERRDAFTRGGVFEAGYRITFKTMTGTTDYIDVPDSEYTPELVRARIDAAVVRLLEVERLHGDDLAD